MIFCTVIQSDQLSAAMVLAQSIKRHHPNAKIAVCAANKNIMPICKKFAYFDQVILAKKIEKGLFNKLVSKYGDIESIRALKAPFLNHLIRTNTDEKIFIYLDPHTKIFSRFDDYLKALKQHSIIFTPYCLEPPSAENVLNEFDLLKNSNINGGFIGVRKTEESLHFLNWWSACVKNDEEEAIAGLYPDEKWLILALGIYDIHIFKDPAYHAAIWNINEKNRSIKFENDSWKVNGEPLCSFFFADLKGEVYTALNKKIPSRSKLKSVQKLFRMYKKERKLFNKYQA